MINNSIPWNVAYYTVGGDWVDLGMLPATTEKLELSSSVHSLFAYGEWILTGGTAFFEDKAFSIGTRLRFTFQDGSIDTVMYMSILSISNGPGTGAKYVAETYMLTLISPWYFSQSIGSGAYYGAIGTTVGAIMANELASSFNSLDIANTYDGSRSVYYRTMMTQSQFLEKIKGNSIGQNLRATFMFTTPQNDFHLIEYNPTVEEDLFTAIDMAHPDIPSFQQELDADQTKFLFPVAILTQFNKSGGESGSLWLDASPSLVYLQPMQGIVKGRYDTPVMEPLTTNQTNPFSYINDTKDKSNATKVYMNDSLQPSAQILNATVNDHTNKLMEYHQFNLYCLPNITVTPGKFCNLHLSKEENGEPSIFAQKFMVESVSHIFQKLKGQTVVTLSAPGLSYERLEKIVGLFHPETR